VPRETRQGGEGAPPAPETAERSALLHGPTTWPICVAEPRGRGKEGKGLGNHLLRKKKVEGGTHPLFEKKRATKKMLCKVSRGRRKIQQLEETKSQDTSKDRKKKKKEKKVCGPKIEEKTGESEEHRRREQTAGRPAKKEPVQKTRPLGRSATGCKCFGKGKGDSDDWVGPRKDVAQKRGDEIGEGKGSPTGDSGKRKKRSTGKGANKAPTS